MLEDISVAASITGSHHRARFANHCIAVYTIAVCWPAFDLLDSYQNVQAGNCLNDEAF